MRVGEESATAKRSNDLVHKICKMIQDGHPYSEIVKTYNVPKSLIDGILFNHEWRNISSQYSFPRNPTKQA